MSTAAAHRVAVLTPPGAGAIALIRVVGPDPVALVNTVFQSKSGRAISVDAPDRLRYGRIVENDETLDDVVATPLTINGVSAVDITAHGGTRIVERILESLQRCGAEVCHQRDAAAWTWEATSPLDREILDAMVHAKTERGLRFLAYQRKHLSDAVAQVLHEIGSNPADAAAGLSTLIDGYRAGRALVEGVTVALIGPPNSGKSTLFNRLLGRDAAMVSQVPGTTRDWIAEPIELLGLPVTLIDTAGRHEAGSPLEALAIEAGRRMADGADLRITVLERGSEQPDARTPGGEDFTVWNKADLNPEIAASTRALAVSGRTGLGLERLAERVLSAFGIEPESNPLPTLFSAPQRAWALEVLAAIHDKSDRAAADLSQRITSKYS